jgi:hypothetical protein
MFSSLTLTCTPAGTVTGNLPILDMTFLLLINVT